MSNRVNSLANFPVLGAEFSSTVSRRDLPETSANLTEPTASTIESLSATGTEWSGHEDVK